MVIKKAVYVWVIVILGMISFAACSSASQGEALSTSNAALDNIFARKSVRAYLDKEVEKEKIDWMLRASMAAPSGKDIRPWEFVLVTDRVVLDSMAAVLPYAKMLTQARYAIVVCGDVAQSSYVRLLHRIYYWLPKHRGWVRYGQLLILMKTVSGLFVNIRSFRGI